MKTISVQLHSRKAVGVLGLGPVGLTWSAFLIRQGWSVYGHDLSNERVHKLRQGELPFQEKGVKEILFSDSKPHAAFKINDDSAEASIWFVCTGFENTEDLANIFRAMDFAQSHGADAIFIRTTLPMKALSPLSEKIETFSKMGVRVGYFPEFMREGAALEDIESHDVFLGQKDDVLANLISEMLPNKVVHSLEIGEAMLLKLSCNAFHALKVTFINEIADVAKDFRLDSMSIAKAFRQDRRLNLSPAYLTPGSAFGGSCLEKDLLFLTQEGQRGKLLSSILPSNDAHKARIYDDILAIPAKTYVLLGDSFKPGTSDTRNSPLAKLAELIRLQGKEISLVNSFEDLKLALENEPDVVVLGTLAPTPSILALLRRSKAIIYDMQYFSDYNVALSQTSNYQSIFP